jgi:glutaminase
MAMSTQQNYSNVTSSATPLGGEAMMRSTIVGLFDEFKGNTAGALADYIPELAKVAPNQFGIALTSNQGKTVWVGDASVSFTIQSISKALTFAMLLEQVGREETYRYVGVQPMAEPFNAITLNPHTNRPFNPMVNTGAIAVAGRLRQILGPDAFAQVLEVFGRVAGRELKVDEQVFQSERETGHRNRAIAHLLRAVGVFDVPVDEVLDLYFRQCSIQVTAIDLSVMGATLANLGVNPVTRKEVLGLDPVRDTLSTMFTCGMYDGAGDWSCKVGLPAKSGVGGGILAVVNRQLGIGVFSPRLDAAGNSVRGQLCCAALSRELGLHAFDMSNMGSSFLQAMTGQR